MSQAAIAIGPAARSTLGTDPAATGRAPAAVVAVLLLLLAIESGGWPLAVAQWASDVLQLGLAVTAAGACAAAALRTRGSARAFWMALSASGLTWAAGQALWTWFSRALGPPRTLEFSDVLFLMSAAPVVIATRIRPDRDRSNPIGKVIDGTLVLVLALHGYVYWGLAFLLTGDVEGYRRVCLQMMDVRSVVVGLSLLALLRGSRPPWRRTYLHLAGALVLFHAGDAVSLRAELLDRYHPGLFDLPWTVPFLWIAITAASWRPPVDEEPGVAAELRPWSDSRHGTVLAMLVVVAVPALHFFSALSSTATPELTHMRARLALATTILVGGLFMLRQLLVLGRAERAQLVREEALKRSEERFEKAFRASPAAVSISTLDEGRFIDANEGYLALTGYSRDELIGRTAGELGLWADPAEQQEIKAALRDKGSLRGCSVAFRHRSGDRRESRTSYEVVEVAGERCLLALSEDVTDRRRLESQLVQAQKMEAVGRLAGGIAHDFNNLLTVIVGFGDLAALRLEETAFARQCLDQMRTAADRASAFTGQLLAFSRKQVLKPEVLDLNAVVLRLGEMLRPLIGEDVELVIVTARGLGKVRADPGQVEQVVMNLAINARDAMPEGGKLTLELRNADLDDAWAQEHDGARPGPYVVLSVRDTGAGMDAALQRRIFEPFFTTKELGKGTGLGLATVYGIVKQSQGYIAVHSAPGRGTTFEVCLPRVDAVAAPASERPRPEAPGGSETILVVEDETPLRDLTRRILEAAGYRVLHAPDGVEALRVADAHDGEIHLLVSDVVLPGMNGRRLAETMLLRRPAMKVLYASGYTDDEVLQRGVFAAGTGFMPKPYSGSVLRARVRELLDVERGALPALVEDSPGPLMG